MATAHHHYPQASDERGFGPLAAVHACNALICEISPLARIGARPELDVQYLAELELLDRLPRWRDVARETVAQEHEVW